MNNGKKTGPRLWEKALYALCAAGVILFLASSIYKVPTNMVAVGRHFGRVFHRLVPPGLHACWPWPIGKINKVRLNETKRVTIGYEAPDKAVGRSPDPRIAEFLTGDENIMKFQMVVLYTIDDPVKYLFHSTSPDVFVQRIAESVLTDAVAKMKVDDLWPTGQVRLLDVVHRETQKKLNALDLGVQIRSVNLQNVAPPAEVAQAFNDVASARQDRERIQHEAEGYMYETQHRALGEAQKMLSEAEAYAKERTDHASGDADRFDKLYAEYTKAKDITSKRLYIEAMEEILPRLRKIIVDSSDANPVDLGIIETKR